MKILHVIPFFSPKFGGSVSSTFLICQYLAEQGQEITILTTDYHFDSSYAQQLKNIEVVPIECKMHAGLFLYSPKMKSWLSQNLAKYDIIHMQTYRSYQNAIICDYAQKLKIPYIVQARGSVLPFFEKQFLKKFFDAMWGNRILANAIRCIAVSSIESDEYLKMCVPKNKIVIIPNGIELSQFTDLPPRGQFRLKYKISRDERIILSLGRIHKIKGIDLLVDAFSRIHGRMGNIKLVIAGPDGGDLSHIRQQVRDLHLEKSVIFTGPLYGKDKLEAYRDATIFVLPSVYEVFGNTVIEAMACGTPVIATKGCQISDVVERAGIVVDYDDDQLKDAIISLIRDEKQVLALGNKGRELALSQFNQDVIIEQVLQTYQECIRQSL